MERKVEAAQVRVQRRLSWLHFAVVAESSIAAGLARGTTRGEPILSARLARNDLQDLSRSANPFPHPASKQISPNMSRHYQEKRFIMLASILAASRVQARKRARKIGSR
jgi:hypothetical protein